MDYNLTQKSSEVRKDFRNIIRNTHATMEVICVNLISNLAGQRRNTEVIYQMSPESECMNGSKQPVTLTMKKFIWDPVKRR